MIMITTHTECSVELCNGPMFLSYFQMKFKPINIEELLHVALPEEFRRRARDIVQN